MPQRTILVPALLLVVGIVVLLVGLDRANSDSVNCGGEPMAPGDLCIPIGGNRSTTTFEQELARKQRNGWLLAAAGGVTSGGGGVLLYWRSVGTRRRNERIARDRSALADAHGWTYLRENPQLLQSWCTSRSVLVTDSAGWNVISGTANCQRFHVFDCEATGVLKTMCAVPLEVDVPEFEVRVLGEGTLLRTSRSVDGYEKLIVHGEPKAARAMLTVAVLEHVKEYRRGFMVVGQSLVVTWPRRASSSGIAPMVDATTKLAALLPVEPGR